MTGARRGGGRCRGTCVVDGGTLEGGGGLEREWEGARGGKSRRGARGTRERERTLSLSLSLSRERTLCLSVSLALERTLSLSSPESRVSRGCAPLRPPVEANRGPARDSDISHRVRPDSDLSYPSQQRLGSQSSEPTDTRILAIRVNRDSDLSYPSQQDTSGPEFLGSSVPPRFGLRRESGSSPR